eukprot:SM000032S12047  [mRNA]  locus=s32:89916:92474:- [translate_table: standard]
MAPAACCRGVLARLLARREGQMQALRGRRLGVLGGACADPRAGVGRGPTGAPAAPPANGAPSRLKYSSGASAARQFTTLRPRAAAVSGVDSSQPAATKALPETAGPPQPNRPLRRGPVSWASLGLLVATSVGLIAYFDYEKKKKIEVVKQGPSAGKAAIGGPFALVDQDGRPVTDKDLAGTWNLLYFGFTYCPDICPDELQKLAKAVDIIEKKANIQVRPVFISVDPERDTVEQVQQYVKEFHPRLMGLTGTPEAVRQAAREYRVYYMKTEEEGDDYLVDHSIIMYLMDPSMSFVKFFGKNYTADALAAGVMEEIGNWKP